MDYWMEHESRERWSSSRRQPVHTLKRCPLCGTLNAAENDDCFTCSWHGSFETDPYEIEAGLIDLMDRCPELTDYIPQRPRRSRFQRLLTWAARLLGRRLDLRM